MISQLSSVAGLLGPRGLMPNPKIGDIIQYDAFLNALALQRSGLGIRKRLFGMDKLF